MPLAGAILWTPVSQPGADPSYPVLITQGAVATMHEHFPVLSEDATSIGFLVGGMYVAPETRVPYVVVESTIAMPWSLGGGHLKAALLQGRALALEEAQRTGRRLLGWYQCHVASHAALSGADVEAHLACFDKPWHIALVVARGVELTGGVFRPGSDGARSREYLPFYELPEAGQGGTALAWANYRAEAVSLVAERRAPLASATPPRVFLPDDADVDDTELEVAPLLAPVPRWLRSASLARIARVGVLPLVASGVLFGAYRAVASGRPGGAGASLAASAATTSDRVNGLADSTGFAVAAFDLRTRLFSAHKMMCADLARGLVEVEDRWTAYNAARGVAGGEALLDASQAARDRRLHSDVSAVEDRFARTGCPRP